MKIFVTGATGFVGSVLIPQLLDIQGLKSIKALKLPQEKIPDYLKNQKIKIINANILDREVIIQEMDENSLVIHLAALISYKKYDYAKLHAVNCQGVKNIVDACQKNNAKRLVHISSVGAIGYLPDGKLADEETPFNWPDHFHYMTTKFEGQKIVLDAIKNDKLNAVILNPASIMGPGDLNLNTPHSQLYNRMYNKKILGSFSGGLAIVDVRDLVSIILKSIFKKSFNFKNYLVVGHNITYSDLLRVMGRISKKKVFPFKVPAPIITMVGAISEFFCKIFKVQPLLTYSYGKISGMYGYYSNKKSLEEYNFKYIPLEKTITDSCTFFTENFLKE